MIKQKTQVFTHNTILTEVQHTSCFLSSPQNTKSTNRDTVNASKKLHGWIAFIATISVAWRSMWCGISTIAGLMAADGMTC